MIGKETLWEKEKLLVPSILFIFIQGPTWLSGKVFDS